ncbi:hypothetical protein N7452_007637 [Penicillium brevicompactum]|uniref:Uncharacterized protein n=1 Tax=Penicillium brevicompactum TaxID=5074 RepID=A0A9W9UDQ6_PENBR|nr:hypothetical protein N7452_007637 [Penicillium brevicompactum]
MDVIFKEIPVIYHHMIITRESNGSWLFSFLFNNGWNLASKQEMAVSLLHSVEEVGIQSVAISTKLDDEDIGAAASSNGVALCVFQGCTE